LPVQIHNEIYRIGREALLNAFRHSGTKSVELELEYTENDLRMCIRDDGCGIDPQMLDAGRQGHWGLEGMRERATRISGLLKLYSYPCMNRQRPFSEGLEDMHFRAGFH